MAILVILVVVLIAVGWQVFSMAKENKKVKDEFNKLASQLETVKKENDTLKEELDYYSKPENLLKELRARFNYKISDEKMIIITQ
ncbi:MAG: septum formation initiator family protein [Candidatus Paceibacterota bacterium]|jgi:cell division protein FtsL